MSEDIVEFEGKEVSLTDVAGINMDDVEEVRFENRPAGTYHMKVVETELKAINKKPAAAISCEVQNCLNLIGEGEPSAQIGKKHNEVFFLNTGDGVGRLKAFLSDAGFKGSGTLTELLDAFHGYEFIGVIKHRKDPNDSDKVYVNFAPGKIKPATETVAA